MEPLHGLAKRDQPVAEAADRSPRVEHDAEPKSLTEAVTQCGEMSGVPSGRRRRRRHLDPDDRSAVLEDDVDLALVAITVVRHARGDVAPADLLGDLADDV